MKIEQRLLTDIHPYGKNAKKHPEKQVKAVAASIKAFGFNQPIVVDATGMIIVGHGRYAAAHSLGLDKVPVLEVDLTEEQAKTYRLADNKLNESEWDMKLVVEELKSLPLPILDLTGFSRNLVLPPLAIDTSTLTNECERCDELKHAVVGHQNRTEHVIFTGAQEKPSGSN